MADGSDAPLSDLADRLREGLGGRYDLIRELGRGGMATVYLARDTRHDRHVAIKVLRPELAHAIGTERFLREIRVAANLTHPNILPLHDSGEVDGLLYYVMPYIEGESLQERLSREGRLPVDDAVRMARQLAGALQHAHGQGVVHRDIKPANVLIAGDQIVLTDFGIARAVDSAQDEALTRTGMIIGTPAYMSPEQFRGDGEIDARSDVYSLACMLYEMLAGEPPFSAPSAQGIMARQAVDRVPSLRKARSLPRSVEFAVEKALARSPAERFQSAADFASALETAPTLSATLTQLVRPRNRRRLAAVLGLVAVLVASALFGSRLIGGGDPAATGIDTAAVAIMPFRLAGAIDPRYRDIATGLPQLLYERLPGDAGPRAVFPTAVASALRKAGLDEAEPPSPEAAARVAIEVGAGQVLLGQAVAAGDLITLNATLYDATNGAEMARAEDVTGPPDSLLSLVDELAAKLLSRWAGVAEQRLPTLLSTRLPALRAYLAGQAEQSAGRYEEAAALFNEALDQDSTFALAGLSLLLIRDHAPGATWARALDAAWSHRDRLSSRDRLVLEAALGPRFPAHPTARELLDARNRVVYEMPERADAWHELGDLRFRLGAFVGMSDPLGEAARAYERALAIDPRHVGALEGRFEVAIREGDTAGVREYGDRFFSLQSGSDAAYHRWRMAIALRDTAALKEIRNGFRDLPTSVLEEIVMRAQLDGVGLADAERAARILEETAGRTDEQNEANHILRVLLLNRGRPVDAAAVPWSARSPEREAWARLHRVVYALYWGADTTDLEPPRNDPLAAAAAVAADPFAPEHLDVCASGLLWNAAGEHEATGRAVRRLRTVPEPLNDLSSAFIEVCAAMLEAERAVALNRPEARRTLGYLDSLMVSGLELFSPVASAANLTAARLFETVGEPDRALAAVRRRRYSGRGVPLLSAMLREEGRLGEAAGDVEGAIDAYRHYLALRYDPEPQVEPEVAAVREALAELIERRPGQSGS